MKHRKVLVAATTVLALVLTIAIAFASTPHGTVNPSSGYDTAGTHQNNPSHLWVVVGAAHSGSITSGGIFHDNCGDAVYPFDGSLDTCYGTGGDYAIDINASAGTPTYLYLDYAGYGQCGIYPYPTPCNPVNLNQSVTIKAKVASGGGSGNCQYRWFDVLASYQDTAGNTFTDKKIGQIELIHQDSWTYSVGTTIHANASKTLPGGSGTLNYISGVQVASVASGSSSCSSGSHVHMEIYSTHMWGGWQEWHSSAGPDFFHLPFSHVHGCDHDGSPCGQGVATPAHSVSLGQGVGFVGGHSMARWLVN